MSFTTRIVTAAAPLVYGSLFVWQAHAHRAGWAALTLWFLIDATFKADKL